MNSIKDYLTFELSGDLEDDVVKFLNVYGYQDVAAHSLAVAAETKGLCLNYRLKADWGYTAGLLHDISVVIPTSERVSLCHQLGLSVDPTEEKLPLILHQRLSKIVAQEIFGIDQPDILNAIECHTTLKGNPSQLDLILFIADKLKWDQADSPPYYDGLQRALAKSLNHGALYFIQWSLAKGMPVIHPWLKEGEQWLTKNLLASKG